MRERIRMRWKTKAKTVYAALLSLAGSVSAAPGITTTVCYVINSIAYAIYVIAPTMVGLMFTYGAIKYIFSADDPGGRKQGKMICIHAIIGGVIIILAGWASSVASGFKGAQWYC